MRRWMATAPGWVRGSPSNRSSHASRWLDRLHRGHRSAAVWAAGQGDLGVFIDVVGDPPVHAGITFGSAGPLLTRSVSEDAASDCLAYAAC